jgi:DMSO reductase family type II enzyme heme b subunit
MIRRRWGDENRYKPSFRLLVTVAVAAILVLHGCKRKPSTKSDSELTAKEAPAAATPVAEKTEPDSLQSDASAPTANALDMSVSAQPESGQQLYARHCAACHGERGDGKGLAAAFLFPKPRDFRAGRFRLVSTNNNVPTREDLHAVLLRGMPGSSMPPWAHLTQQERDALVDEVLRLRLEGARESYVQQLKDEEGLTDEEIAAADVQEEIDDYAKESTTPGDSSVVPQVPAPTDEAIAHGKDVYANFACIACHGETGRGDGVQEMFDDEKLPTRPRDFTLGIFKGNHDPESLYRRIAYGMPGSPMPGSSTMTPDQMMDLVHYIRSLSTDEQREASVPERKTIVAKRVKAVPQSGDAAAWASSTPVQLRMTPLWWRNDSDAELTAQALHDGKSIAVRLTWKDATADEHALQSDAFEDAVALELYRGASEPFLGMGDQTAPVDVWFWDADRQNNAVIDEEQYANTVVDVFPFSEAVAAGPDITRPGARMTDQPAISLPARAVGNLIVPGDDESGGSALHVGGPRTVTFRIPQSQLVRAVGTWSDGRWTVVMTRTMLLESPEEGVALEPGGRASVAFALWDGSHEDRNGQKSVTIWQDLLLEK